MLKKLFRRDISAALAPSIIQAKQAKVTQITQLPNGLRVASEPLASHFVGVGAYIDIGSAQEPSDMFGLSHFSDRLAFKATQSQTREQIQGTIERMGGSVSSASTRENISYQATIFTHDVAEVVKLYADVIRKPVISQEDIQATKDTIAFEIEDNYAKPEWLATEMAHKTAFSDKTLGRSPLCTTEALTKITREKISKFRNKFYNPENIVLTAIGVEHDFLVDLAEKHFGDMPAGTFQNAVEPTKYTGGHLIYPAPPPPTHIPQSPFTHFFIGFEGRSYTHDQIFALSVLQVMLGGGDSFSAGGPGKGMYSHFYTRVLNKYHWVDKVQACNFPYAQTGLFGVHCAVPANLIPIMLEILGTELRRIVDRGVSMEEVTRAKNQLRSQVMMNLETRVVALEDIGRQVQVKGYRMQPWEISEKIEQVTAEDVRVVLEQVITETKPTLVVIGGTKRHIPTLAQISGRMGLGKL